MLEEFVLGNAVSSCHQALHEPVHAIPSPSAEPSRPRELACLFPSEEIFRVGFAMNSQEFDCRPAVDGGLGMDVCQDQQGDNGRDGGNVC
ncbi:MAG: hypothetical protein OXG69_05255 [bacterium]|nr:hypothetical protein [bacterium]